MVSQGVRVYEVAFWDPTPTAQLARTSRAPSCPEFIDVVDNYTLLLHQGLIEHAFLDEIEAVSPPFLFVRLFPLLSQLMRTFPSAQLATAPTPPPEIRPCSPRRCFPSLPIRHLLQRPVDFP